MSSLTRRTIVALLDLSLTGGAYIAYLFFGEPSQAGIIAFMAFFVLYFPVAEGITGQTLFKAIFGIKAIEQVGRKPSIKASFIRHFFDGIDFLLGIGLFVAANRPDKKRIGDLVAGTIVVRVGQEDVTIPEVTADVTPEPVGFRPKRPALAGQRAIAFLIDYTTYFTIYFILAKFVLPEGKPNDISSFFNLFITIALWLLIIVLPESMLGYTLGKGAFDLKVAKLRESDSMFIVSLKRHLFDFVEFCLYFGLVSFIMIIKTKDHQRIGDMVARSIVVKDQ